MIYNVSVVTSASECDALILDATSDKSKLEAKKLSLQNQVNDNTNNTVLLPQQLAALELQIATCEAQLEANTDPDEELTIELELHMFKAQRIRLLKKAGNSDAQSMMEKQLSVAKVESEIEIVEEYMTVLQTRKTELETAA